ncbi:putative B3 domain-containing protein Os03g0621600 [Malania oleifera]|uniref:putative B3 domain-containing protein Os03g0621600 n=1 Tax=Malania oleifera TaxID=397392 RepID=UPI0025AE899D|nr:putative B3 domain-containing protein Os03g0621600 [Malania oleifera]
MARLRRRRMLSSGSRHEFFKIFLQQFSSQRMRIPPAFIQHFDGNIPNTALLKDHGGRCCEVEVEEDDNGVFMSNGWEGFVNDHTIEQGDFLIFRYDGKSTFDVKIFGKNGCQKCQKEEEVLAIDKFGPPVCVKEGELTNEAEQTCQTPPLICKKELSQPAQITEHSDSRGLHYRDQSKRIASAKLEIHRLFDSLGADLPKNPCFLASVGMRYILNIPRLVVLTNRIKLNDELVIRNWKGRWQVGVIFKKERISVTTGWVKFWRDNKLSRKDHCVFEFVVGRGGSCKELRAHIFYAGAGARAKVLKPHGHRAVKRP